MILENRAYLSYTNQIKLQLHQEHICFVGTQPDNMEHLKRLYAAIWMQQIAWVATMFAFVNFLTILDLITIL